MSEHPDFSGRQLLDALVRAGVEFVVVGGLAAQAHGSPLMTSDLDICHDLDRANLERLAAALADLAATRRDVPDGVSPPLDVRALRAGDVFTLRTRHGDLDLLSHPDPGLSYEALRARAIRFEVFGMPLWVASLDDVIAMKRAAGRDKDLLALQYLEHLGALREEIDRRS
jgi:hypothetical protein